MFGTFVFKELKMQGFLYWNRSDEERQAALAELTQWVKQVSLAFASVFCISWEIYAILFLCFQLINDFYVTGIFFFALNQEIHNSWSILLVSVSLLEILALELALVSFKTTASC